MEEAASQCLHTIGIQHLEGKNQRNRLEYCRARELARWYDEAKSVAHDSVGHANYPGSMMEATKLVFGLTQILQHFQTEDPNTFRTLPEHFPEVAPFGVLSETFPASVSAFSTLQKRPHLKVLAAAAPEGCRALAPAGPPALARPTVLLPFLCCPSGENFGCGALLSRSFCGVYYPIILTHLRIASRMPRDETYRPHLPQWFANRDPRAKNRPTSSCVSLLFGIQMKALCGLWASGSETFDVGRVEAF